MPPAAVPLYSPSSRVMVWLPNVWPQRSSRQSTVRWASRRAMVVSGGGSVSGQSRSGCQRPSRSRTLMQPGTGSQRYSASVIPVMRSRSAR
jgi:hypothetical protein